MSRDEFTIGITTFTLDDFKKIEEYVDNGIGQLKIEREMGFPRNCLSSAKKKIPELAHALRNIPKRGGAHKTEGEVVKRNNKKEVKNPFGRKSNLLTDEVLGQIEFMSNMGCTQKEIAASLRITPQWLSESKHIYPQVHDALDGGYLRGQKCLRSAQYEKALSGDCKMLIWLGKQRLAQSEKSDYKIEHSESDVDLTNVSVETIEKAIKLIEDEIGEDKDDD